MSSFIILIKIFYTSFSAKIFISGKKNLVSCIS
nr:MAG TPA: hypothetical protein [Caudoviricetes sp.]